MIEVTLLGTAATLPRPERALTACVLTCSGRSILLDCGEGTQLALHRSPVSPMKIDLIALTHYHGDHYFGLPGLLQTLGTMNRTSPLYITGPEGLRSAMQPVLTMAETDQLPYEVRLLEMTREPLALSALNPRWPEEATLTAFPTEHRIVSQGYRLDLARKRRFNAQKAEALGIPRTLWRELQRGRAVWLQGRTIRPEEVCGSERRGLSVVFSGDTAPCETLLTAAREADLLIMDATYPTDEYADKAALYGHSTFPQAAALARDADAKELWLVHYSALIEDASSFLPGAQSIFPAAACTEDGMHRTLVYE